MKAISLQDLRRYAISRSLFAPTTLHEAIDRLGFVQADPIRAPARAQDLILRHRVHGYHAGDLEQHYPTLAIDEEFFVNYGFLPHRHAASLQPRKTSVRRGSVRHQRMEDLLAFVRSKTEVHPREAAAQFAHGRVTNYWGGASSATTQLLDHMHFQGLLRVARRDNGIRVYAAREAVRTSTDARARLAQAQSLMQLIVRLYAPLPARSLSQFMSMLRRSAPQLTRETRSALARAKHTLAHASIAGAQWYWPADEQPLVIGQASDPAVRLLAPFDPIVWDRRRFEQFWGWAYRFEAYTPVAKRRLGYYALPLLWRDEIIGWANISLKAGQLQATMGYVSGSKPKPRVYARALDAELARVQAFLQRP